MNLKPEEIKYWAEAKSTGGRDGRSQTPEKLLDVRLVPPKELGGSGEGINPEQLFACGYSACFLGAIKAVATREKVTVPTDSSIVGRVGIGPIPQGFNLKVELRISMPGLDKFVAQSLIDKAHQVCPYSNATRDNIDVTLTLV